MSTQSDTGTVDQLLAQGRARLADNRAERAAAEAAAEAKERAAFDAEWAAPVAMVRSRWPSLADLLTWPQFDEKRDSGQLDRPSHRNAYVTLHVPAYPPIRIVVDGHWDAANKVAIWKVTRIVVCAWVIRGEYEPFIGIEAAHELTEHDMDIALAAAAEIAAKRPELEAELAQIKESKRLRAIARHEREAQAPTRAERALALMDELLSLLQQSDAPDY